LTEEQKFKNWKEFGHPQGSLAIKAVELLLPQFLMDPEVKPMLLTAAFLIMIGIVLAVVTM